MHIKNRYKKKNRIQNLQEAGLTDLKIGSLKINILMKRIIIKLGDKLMIPLSVMAGGYFLFSNDLSKIPYIFIFQYILIIIGVIVFISGFLQLIDKLSNK